MTVRRLASLSAIALLIATTSITTPVLAPKSADAAGPVAEWTFDDASGTVAHDAVGGLDGAITGGATWISSGVPQGTHALQFDGIDDLVTVANDPRLEPHDDFTITLWARGTVSISSLFPLIQKGMYACDAGGSWEIDQNWSELTASGLAVTYPYPLSFGWSGPSSQVWTGAWHHIAMVVDDSADVTTVYMDGHASASSWPAPDEIRYGGPGLVDPDLRIGGPAADCPYRKPFAGAIDDVRLYDAALGRSAILAQLPATIPTTTELTLYDAGHTGEGDATDTAFIDRSLLFVAHVTPWPADAGQITWYRSKDGGPEEAFATDPLDVTTTPGYRFMTLTPGEMGVGDYTIRAAWSGASNWQASSSPPMPLSIVKRPVVMELWASPPGDVPGGGTTLTARALVEDPPATYLIPGAVEFHETTDGGDTLVGTGTLGFHGDGNWNSTSLQVTGLSTGTHTYEARYPGSPTLASGTATRSVVIGPQVSGLDLAIPDLALATEQATATVSLYTASAGSSPTPGGTITLTTSPGGVVVGSAVVTHNGAYQIPLPLYPVGTQSFVATYSGDVDYNPATSPTRTLTIVADTVKATGVGLQYTTVYPIKDGYRDTVAIRGARQEVAGVSIRIYSPSGSRLKTVSIAKGSGAYSYAWNGRNSAGSVYASGKYKVIQVLTDASGTTRSVTTYVNLSHKKISMHTAYLTKSSSQAARRTKGWLAWNFTLPSAAVYTGLRVYAYGVTQVPPGGFGAQDFSRCGTATYDPSCVTRSGYLPYSPAWRSRSASPSLDRTGRGVRVYAWASYAGVAAVGKVKIKVAYGILR